MAGVLSELFGMRAPCAFVKDLRRKATALKEVVADLTLENRLLKKSMSGDGEDEA
jgi:hypothetical protein